MLYLLTRHVAKILLYIDIVPAAAQHPTTPPVFLDIALGSVRSRDDGGIATESFST